MSASAPKKPQTAAAAAKKSPVASPEPSPTSSTSTSTSTSTPATTEKPTTPAKQPDKQQPSKQGKPKQEGHVKSADGEEKQADSSSGRTDLTDTAAHILKGAIVSILGKEAALTDSVQWKGVNKAILNIRWAGETIPQDKIAAIQAKANEIIKAGLPVERINMERGAAEEKYSAQRVNDTYIYDAREPHASVTTLTLTHIPSYNINACRGPHVATTRDVIAISLVKPKRRANGGTYEFTYVCGEAALKSVQSDATPTPTPVTSSSTPPATTTSSKSKSKSAPTTSSSVINTSKKSHVDTTLDDVIATVLQTLKDSQVNGTDAQYADVQARLRESLHRPLVMFGNASFANGYAAHVPHKQPIDPILLKSGPGL